jgi:signal peptidase I
LRNPIDRLFPNLPHGWRVALDWIFTIAGAILIVLAIKAWVVNPYRIPSSSMEPTLHCARPKQGCEARFSDRVLANRFIYHFRDPHRGEIVVFNTPPAAQQACGEGGTFVKRILALPGEQIQERPGGVFYVRHRGGRWEKVDDSKWVPADRRRADTTQATWPGSTTYFGSDQYFMVGDNRGSSCDSRRWGAVPRKNLIGPVFAIYWPPNRISLK